VDVSLAPLPALAVPWPPLRVRGLAPPARAAVPRPDTDLPHACIAGGEWPTVVLHALLARLHTSRLPARTVAAALRGRTYPYLKRSLLIDAGRVLPLEVRGRVVDTDRIHGSGNPQLDGSRRSPVRGARTRSGRDTDHGEYQRG